MAIKASNVPAALTRGPLITLDGPAGSGKSSTAQEVARRLGFRHLDSGALYRALTFALLEEGVAEHTWGALEPFELDPLGLRVEAEDAAVNIYRNGVLLTSELRGPGVTERVAMVAGVPAVREWLLEVQRSLGAEGNLVADGRDMGTVVFPKADLKVFLIAGLEERARRRLIQDFAREPTMEEIKGMAERIEQRDQADQTRDHSPLKRPEDAVDLDTTAITFDDQVSFILRRIKDLTRLQGEI